MLQQKSLIAVKGLVSGAQSIASGGNVVINLPAESYDTNGMHDNAVNNSRLTMSQQADLGNFFGCVIAYIEFATNATLQRRLDVILNGGSFTPLVAVLAAASNPTRLSALSVFRLAAVSLNGFFQMQGGQSSGAPLNVTDGYLAFALPYGGPASSLRTFVSRITRSSNQSIANNDTTQAVSFTTDVIDNCPIPGVTQWSAGSPTRLTIREDGRYLVTGIARFFANAAGDRGAEVRLNGATLVCAQMIKGSSIAHNAAVMGIGQFVAGDYLELYVYQNSGGALNISAAELCAFKEPDACITDDAGSWLHY